MLMRDVGINSAVQKRTHRLFEEEFKPIMWNGRNDHH